MNRLLPGLQLRVRNLFFSYFSTKTYVVGTQKNRLNETVHVRQHFVFFFATNLKKFNNTGTRMLDSIYHMTLLKIPLNETVLLSTQNIC